MESQDLSKKLLDSDYNFAAYRDILEAKENEICKKINEYQKSKDKATEYDITDIEKLLDEQLIILEKQLIIFEKISLNLQDELDILSKGKDKIAEYMEKKETMELLNSMKNGVIKEIIRFEMYYNESYIRVNNLLKKHQINLQDNYM